MQDRWWGHHNLFIHHPFVYVLVDPTLKWYSMFLVLPHKVRVLCWNAAKAFSSLFVNQKIFLGLETKFSVRNMKGYTRALKKTTQSCKRVSNPKEVTTHKKVLNLVFSQRTSQDRSTLKDSAISFPMAISERKKACQRTFHLSLKGGNNTISVGSSIPITNKRNPKGVLKLFQIKWTDWQLYNKSSISSESPIHTNAPLRIETRRASFNAIQTWLSHAKLAWKIFR